MQKFKIGDKVRVIRTDCEYGISEEAINLMIQKGTVTISAVRRDYAELGFFYELEEDENPKFEWHEDMLELVESLKEDIENEK